jgi:transcriptional regulator with XRE-family HTH domain
MNTKLPSQLSSLWLAYPEEVAVVSLGEKLKLLRKEKGWSQDELAFHAQIDGRQVSRYENDRVMPSIEVIIKIAKAYEVSIDYLLPGVTDAEWETGGAGARVRSPGRRG